MRKRRRNHERQDVARGFLREAWERVRRNGRPGWTGRASRTSAGVVGGNLREGTYRPKAVRQVRRRNPGKFRPLGMVAQLLVLDFEAGNRYGRHAMKLPILPAMEIPGEMLIKPASTGGCSAWLCAAGTGGASRGRGRRKEPRSHHCFDQVADCFSDHRDPNVGSSTACPHSHCPASGLSPRNALG